MTVDRKIASDLGGNKITGRKHQKHEENVKEMNFMEGEWRKKKRRIAW